MWKDEGRKDIVYWDRYLFWISSFLTHFRSQVVGIGGYRVLDGFWRFIIEEVDRFLGNIRRGTANFLPIHIIVSLPHHMKRSNEKDRNGHQDSGQTEGKDEGD